MPKVKATNVQGEIYLTDIIEIAYTQKKKIGAKIGGDRLEVMGINTLQELECIEFIMKQRAHNIT